MAGKPERNLVSFSYRKVVSNNCTDGVREQYTAKPQQCPGKAPHGLRISTLDGKLTAEQGQNVTFVLQLEEVVTDLMLLCSFSGLFVFSTFLCSVFFWV